MPRTLALLALAFLAPLASADDWPQWMGPNRDGVWAETGIVKTLPNGDPNRGNQLKPVWSVPVHAGYSGPAVADGRVYVTDRVLAKGARNPDDPFDIKEQVNSTERVLCLDAKTGKELWAKNFPKDYATKVPLWGYCGHPLVYRNLLVCVGGGPNAVAVAFDKDTGAEKWKALASRDPGYAPPTLIRAGGVDQLVIWHGHAINGLDPLTGKPHWSVGCAPLFAMSIMAPRQHGDRLFAAGIGGAGVVLKLDKDKPAVTVLWQEATDKSRKPKERGLYPVNMAPLVVDGVVYGVDQPGMLRAVELETGKKLWFTHKPVIGREEPEDYKGAGSGTAFVVKNGDRYFLFAETGELVIAKLSPKGYEEVSRAKLLDPTGAAFGRKVVWSHPAFANKSVYARNDKELACFSLAE